MLHELGLKYGTDKADANHTFDGSSYLHVLETYLAPKTDMVRGVIEIGVRRGASLRMWEEYFPAATVVGVDIDPACTGVEFGARVRSITGDQRSPEVLEAAVQACGGEVDLIVDDGAHLNEYTLATLRILFPRLAHGGLYVIEDLANSYVMDIYSDMKRGRWAYGYLDPANPPHNDRRIMDAEFRGIIAGLDKRAGTARFLHFWSQMVVIGKVWE